MSGWLPWLRRVRAKLHSPVTVPLPILVHTHPADRVPPGPLEPGMVQIEQDDGVVHAVAGVVNPDGTIGDLSPDKLEWARRLTYRHLKREGCLEEFGIPLVPAYEQEIAESPAPPKP